MHIVKIVIAFFILFNFPIPIVYNSAMLALLISLWTYAIKPELLSNVRKMILNRNVVYIIATLVFIIFWSFAIAVLRGTYDFYIIKAFLLQLFLLCVAVLSYPILVAGYANQFYIILRLLIIVFLIQSLIECAGFVSPQIREFIQRFQKSNITEIDFKGLRGLALSGNPFFDLSSAFGLIYIFYIKFILERSKDSFNILSIAVVSLLLIGTFFAGRTGFVGFAIAILLYLFNFGKFGVRLLLFIKLILVQFSILFLVFVFLPSSIKDTVENQLLPFAFEFVYTYLEEGEVSTESTDVLNKMYFPISLKTFFLGDGRYMEQGEEGIYYMQTDAGYMRHTLFYGITGPLLLLVYQLQFFRRPLKRIINLYNTNRKKYFSDLLFFCTILIYLFIINYKGEVIGFLPITQVMVFWICFSYINIETSSDKNE